MEINEEKKGDVLILGLSGKLDATSAKAFEDRILAVIDAGERQLVVDLSRLDYVSSSGLRVFLFTAKLLNSANGKIVLCSLKDPVREVFDIAGFLSIFSVYGSQDEAVKSL
ncbi:MAG: STAS domain-containing protein [Deltaproteobacteria bacterium]|nr:STAS domain-containing protein [Deltaproteobacteria bacterium]